MSEVEKMYRNSGIKKTELDYPDNFDPFYPDFTAEKQLGLIKWLSSIKDFEFESVFARGLYIVGCRECVSNNKHWAENKQFEEALAELINDL